jgi:hypothetical protein
MGGPQNRSGRGGEEKNSQPLPGIEHQNPDRSARSPALYRLSYHGSTWVRKQNKYKVGVLCEVAYLQETRDENLSGGNK